MGKYSYLKKYIDNSAPPPRNRFRLITQEEIDIAEKRLGFKFPDSLKEFWLEAGEGTLYVTQKGDVAFNFNNIIYSPKEIADIILLKEDSLLILPDVVEYFDEGYINISKGEIIFFEIGDSSSFLVMKPNSNKPDAVYDMIGNIVEESLERFIWRLYYESATFYLKY